MRSAPGIRTPYTVVGGPRWDRIRKYPYPLTILVLSRGDRLFHAELLRDLQARGKSEILWVEDHHPSSDVETLSREFPDVRFLLITAPLSFGERLNIGIAESRAPMTLCMWSDTRLSRFPASRLEAVEKSGAVCTVPLIRTHLQEPFPAWQSPQWKRRRLSVAFRIPRQEGEQTLFPFDYCGVYDRERFARTGGFDPDIPNPYWQKLDFGFRCFLWGEKIRGTTGIALDYSAPPPTDDATPDRSYKLFYLKCMAVRFRRETGVLPTHRLLDYMIKSDTGPIAAVKEFREVRQWVSTNRSRFRRDSRDIIEKWESV